MEPEIADLLAELDPAVYVLDALPNMTDDVVTERAAAFVRKLRAAHSRTPIVLVEDRTYGNAWIRADLRARNDTSRVALRNACEALWTGGMRDLLYVPGEHLFGDDDEATVDRSHPSDLGFVRMADALEPVLRALL
jgi:lysophospholipase L1-like esterase